MFRYALVLLSCSVMAGETITASEVGGYRYENGMLRVSERQLESTYYLEGDTVTRVRSYDLGSGEVIPDGTIFYVQQKWPVIHAFGRPEGGVELLLVGDDYVQSVRSVASHFVISRAKRIK